MGNSTQGQQEPPNEQAARYILDRLVQDLLKEILPILRTGSKFSIEGNHSGDLNEIVKLKISKFIN